MPSHQQQQSERMRSSTPVKSSPDRLRLQVEELQRAVSKLGVENEELKFELNQTKKDFEALSLENQQLYEQLQEKEVIQETLSRKLDTARNVANVLCDKIRAFKYKQYNALWLGGSNGGSTDEEK